MIEVRNLTKKYGTHTVVSDLSFTVEKGRLYGLFGPNGAGKTTILEIIAGCLDATAGGILVDGHSLSEEPQHPKHLIGYLPEQAPLYMDMTPPEYLHFAASAKGIPHDGLLAEINRVMELAGIQKQQDQMIKNLSKGNRQRIGIAQALLGDPENILLDEPTAGLEHGQASEIQDLIRTVGQDHTVILANSDPSEVMAVCDSILLISSGKLILTDTRDHLTELLAGAATLTLEVKAEEEEVRAALDSVQQIEDIAIKVKERGVIIAKVKPEERTDIREAVFMAFADAGLPLREIKTEQPALEDLLFRLIQASNDPFERTILEEA